MPQAQRVFLSSLLRFVALLGGLAICLGVGSPDLSWAKGSKDIGEPARYWSSAERWAWSQIKQGEIADFNERCRTKDLDLKDENDARWQDDCGELSPRFLVDLLTQGAWREQVPAKGVQIVGARIAGDLDLENAKLLRSIVIYGSRIEGAINLMRAHTESLILLANSVPTSPPIVCTPRAVCSSAMARS